MHPFLGFVGIREWWVLYISYTLCHLAFPQEIILFCFLFFHDSKKLIWRFITNGYWYFELLTSLTRWIVLYETYHLQCYYIMLNVLTVLLMKIWCVYMLEWNPIGFLCDIYNRFSHLNVQNGFEVIPRQSQFNTTNLHVARLVSEKHQYGRRNMP